MIILSQPIYSIDLSKILLEKFFIVEEHEQLTRNIEKYGLAVPLSVEGPIRGDHYILVDGYKRYKSLIQLGWTNVQCKVESVTDDAHRILKRLRWDYSKKKMKSKERIRYVHWLLNLNWTVDEIAKGTGIALEVIRKYKKIKYVNQQSKDLINSLGLGDEALLAVDRMRDRLPSKIYNNIIEELINYPKIHGYHVDAIECLSKAAGFSALPETSIRNVIKETIEIKTFRQKEAQKIVDIESAIIGMTKNDAAILNFCEFALCEANKMNRITSSSLMRNAPPGIRNKIFTILKNCLAEVK